MLFLGIMITQHFNIISLEAKLDRNTLISDPTTTPLQVTPIPSFNVLIPINTSHESPSPTFTPSVQIEITVIPPKGESPKKGLIEGTIKDLKNPEEYKVVIYSFTNVWFVQPSDAQPLTDIGTNGSWSNNIFLGSEYAVLLVKNSYSTPSILDNLPAIKGEILAIKKVKGKDI